MYCPILFTSPQYKTITTKQTPLYNNTPRISKIYLYLITMYLIIYSNHKPFWSIGCEVYKKYFVKINTSIFHIFNLWNLRVILY